MIGWVSGVNPVTRVAVAFVLAVAVFLSVDVVSAAVMVVLLLASTPLSGLVIGGVLLRMAPVLVAGPIAAASVLVYARPEGRIHISWGFWIVSDGSVMLAVAVLLRVIALALPTVLLFAHTDATELAGALAQVARLPARIVLAVLAGTRTLGLLLEDWRVLRLARRARGVGDTGAVRRFFGMAFALLVIAVRRGTALATAMEARGFGAPIARTWWRPSVLGERDAFALAGGVVIAGLSVGAAVAAGTFRLVGT